MRDDYSWWTCPRCNYPNSAETVFCMDCSYDRNTQTQQPIVIIQRETRCECPIHRNKRSMNKVSKILNRKPPKIPKPVKIKIDAKTKKAIQKFIDSISRGENLFKLKPKSKKKTTKKKKK